jgi:hypothetical protein
MSGCIISEEEADEPTTGVMSYALNVFLARCWGDPILLVSIFCKSTTRRLSLRSNDKLASPYHSIEI